MQRKIVEYESHCNLHVRIMNIAFRLNFGDHLIKCVENVAAVVGELCGVRFCWPYENTCM